MAEPYSVGPYLPARIRRLHLNEYRYPHALSVVEALRKHAAEIPEAALLNSYQAGPDPDFAEELARYVGAPSAASILATQGSDEALRAIIDTCGLPTVVMAVPTYTHFEHYATLRGLRIHSYSIGLRGNETKMAALSYYRPYLAEGSLVYLCSPNNPTGDIWTEAEVKNLASAYPSSLFLVDEAYTEFAGAAAAPAAADDASALNYASVVPVALRYSNVVVTRTFSKAFGLAAMRVGYAVGTPTRMGILSSAVSPKEFSVFGVFAARRVLGQLRHYRLAAEAARDQQSRLIAGLSERGWWVQGTAANFVLVYVGRAAAADKRLLEAGIAVRDRSMLPGLAGFVRVTAGTAEDTAATLAAFEGLARPGRLPPQLSYTSKADVAGVKELVRAAMAMFDRMGVQVWAQSGTMLGVIRHVMPPQRGDNGALCGGMIPTDDDADLAYLLPADGSDPLAELIIPFALEGYTLQRNRTDAYWQLGTNAPSATISRIHIDIFSYSGSADRGYTLDDPRFRDETPNCPQAHCNTRYQHDELFPLVHRWMFYDIPMPMPARSRTVLLRALGADCLEVMRARTPLGLMVVPLEDFTPA